MEEENRVDSEQGNLSTQLEKEVDSTGGSENTVILYERGEPSNLADGMCMQDIEAEQVNTQKQGNQPIPRMERRTSTRLRKELAVTTEEKVTRMGQKRNLEGTNLNPENSFSVLANDDIMQLSLNMGIELNDSNFVAIDFIKDLEIARHALAEKKLAPPENTTEEEPILEVVEEEFSDVEMYAEQPLKRRGRPKKKTLFLSLSGPRKNTKNKGNPGSKKPKGGDQGNLDPPVADKQKKG